MTKRGGGPVGHPRQPAAITRLHGGKVPDRGPALPPAPLDPPAELTDGAREFWRTYAPPLIRQGVLTEVDLPLFSELAESWSVLRRARELIAADGDIIAGPRGSVRHPAHLVIGATLPVFHSIGARFGMNPSARAGMVTGDPVEHDDLISGF